MARRSTRRVVRRRERVGGGATPFLTAVDRLASSRWLAARGASAEAARLLTWYEGVPYPESPTRQANTMGEGYAYLARGRDAEALDQKALARAYYGHAVALWDAPVPATRRLVDEARARLSRR